MRQELTLFIGMFTTLLAIINPLEALPVFLKLLDGKSEEEHLRVARLACTYAMLLAFFFLFFGKFIMWIFGVPLSMVRIVAGIVLLRIGFDLFSSSPSAGSSIAHGPAQDNEDVAFVPLAMPIMFGPGAIATVLGMVSLVKHRIRSDLRCSDLCSHCRDDVCHILFFGLREESSEPDRIERYQRGNTHRRFFCLDNGYGTDFSWSGGSYSNLRSNG